MDKILLAERFGWTFDHIDDMDDLERAETVTALDAIDKARAYANRPKTKGGKR